MSMKNLLNLQMRYDCSENELYFKSKKLQDFVSVHT